MLKISYFHVFMLKVEYFSAWRKISLSSRTCKFSSRTCKHIVAASLNLVLCLCVCLVSYCPHCLPPTSGEQAGNKRQDRHTNRALSARRHPQYAAKKKKLLPLLMSGVTFQFNSHVLESLLKESHDELTPQICPKKFTNLFTKNLHFYNFSVVQ